MADEWYYDFMNPNSALAMALHKQNLLFGVRYLKDILSTKISMFRYKGIEKIKGLTSEILETALVFNWFLCIYSSGAGIGLFRFVPSSLYSQYMKPKTVDIIALNGTCIATNVPYEKIVPVRDNACEIAPFIPMVEYINQVQRIDDTIFKILNTLSLPIVLAGSKKLTNQLKETAKKLGSSDPYIVGDDQLVDTVKAFNIDVPINPSDVYLLKTKYKNELLTSMGIYSIEEKRERKIVSEVQSQNDFTDHIYNDMLFQRKETWRLVKEKYGIEVEVEESYMESVKQSVKEAMMMALATGQKKSEEDKQNDA